MGELKSAWEIAREKADKLGKLSAEEERQQKEKECHQIGTALAQRYLDHAELQNIAAAINHHPEGGKDLIKRAALNCLAETISLKNLEGSGEVTRLVKAIQGIAMIEPSSQQILEQITQLAREYEQAERKARGELQSKGKEILHRLRISGTAVGDINIEALPQWQLTRQQLAERFRLRFDSLKQDLFRFFSTECA